MVAFAILCSVHVLLYGYDIVQLTIGFTKIPELIPSDSKAETGFSILIPFRNEHENLGRLLESITELDYPKELFELIFIDDASTDDSVALVNRWRMQNGLIQTTLIENIQITPSPKKNAILRSVPIAAFDWIVTTDADCSLPSAWLKAFDTFIKKESVEMIAAPVRYAKYPGILAQFQQLDFLSLQAVTVGSFGIGKPFMCNGANFAYAKSFFNALGGFAGNEKIASGDDVFLLQKAVKTNPKKIGYLKSESAIVETLPEKSLGKLFHQRVRWAAKAASYENQYAENLSLLVFLANLSVLIGWVLAISGVVDWSIAAGIFLLKLLPDWILLHKANKFFKCQSIVFPVFAALFYPVFIVSVALFSLVGNYSWKGRRFRV